jgi:hypothetical protein
MNYGWQIHEALLKDSETRKAFKGVCPVDELKGKPDKLPAAYVINTAERTQRGEHWVALHIDPWGVGTYFDSYGLPPRHAGLVAFLNRHTIKWIYNQRPIQGLLSSACGLFCLYFLYFKCRGYSLVSLLRRFRSFNWDLNDDVIQNWYTFSFRRRLVFDNLS